MQANESVFINCPFDKEYEPTFYAIIFATVCCGFLPRCTLEHGKAVTRLEKILEILFQSKYSIHDLSRCKGEKEGNLARFNMPLELGIAIGRRYSQPKNEEKHDWLVLVPKGHTYQKFVSDLAGFDPQKYSGAPTTVIPIVVFWLKSQDDPIFTPTPKMVLKYFKFFEAKRKKLVREWKGRTPWKEILRCAVEISSDIPIFDNAINLKEIEINVSAKNVKNKVPDTYKRDS